MADCSIRGSKSHPMEGSEGSEDAGVEPFLDFLAQDLADRPEAVQPLDRSFFAMTDALTDGVEIDLDQPLDDEEE